MKKGLTLLVFLGIVFAFAWFVGGEIGLKVRTFTEWMSKSVWGDWKGISPSWAIVYGLMGVGAWLVWESAPPEERILPMLLFGAQLLTAALWSQTTDLKFQSFLLLLLGGLLIFTMAVFWHHNRWGAILVFPYFAWVLFAGLFNAWIVELKN